MTVKRINPKTLPVALLMLLCATSNAQADPPIYENFKGSVLNSGRWLGGRVDVGMIDMRRVIRRKDNAMHLRIRGLADDTQTSGERLKVINRIWVDADKSPSLRSLQTYVKVNKASVGACDLTGAADSRSAYQNLGIWFNNGSSSSALDRLGDVYTTIGLRKSADTTVADDELEVRAYVGRCADSNCDTSVNFYNEVIGTYTLGTNTVLRTTWDETLKEFRFYVRPKGGAAQTAKFIYDDVVADGSAPGTAVWRTHGVQVRSDAADCNMSGLSSEHPYGMIDAFIYNVRISDTPDGL